MRTTVDLHPDALRIAKAISAEKKLSLGKYLSALILAEVRLSDRDELGTSTTGFRTFAAGRLVTAEEVREFDKD